MKSLRAGRRGGIASCPRSRCIPCFDLGSWPQEPVIELLNGPVGVNYKRRFLVISPENAWISHDFPCFSLVSRGAPEVEVHSDAGVEGFPAIRES